MTKDNKTFSQLLSEIKFLTTDEINDRLRNYYKEFSYKNNTSDVSKEKIDSIYRKPVNFDLPTKNFRMYSIVLGQLSPIQKGIQAAHSMTEYSNLYYEDLDYKKWATVNKTVIILDAKNSDELKYLQKLLLSMLYKFSSFSEESLEGLNTCISFLVPEEVYAHLGKLTLDDFNKLVVPTLCQDDKKEAYKLSLIFEILNTHKLSK